MWCVSAPAKKDISILMENVLDTLIDRIPDEAMQGHIREALQKQNQQKKFGLAG